MAARHTAAAANAVRYLRRLPPRSRRQTASRTYTSASHQTAAGPVKRTLCPGIFAKAWATARTYRASASGTAARMPGTGRTIPSAVTTSAAAKSTGAIHSTSTPDNGETRERVPK